MQLLCVLLQREEIGAKWRMRREGENNGNFFVFSCHGSMFMLFCIQDSDSLKIRREDKQTKRISSDGKEYRAGIVEEEFI